MPPTTADAPFNDKSLLPAMLDDIDVRLLWAQRDELSPGDWDHAQLANDFWRLYQNDRDGGYLTSAGHEIALEARAIYIVPAGLELSSRSVSPFSQFFVHFDLRGVPPIVFHELFPGPMAVPHDPLFVDAVAALAERVARDGCGGVAIQYLLKGIVYEAFGHYLSRLPADLVERCGNRMTLLQDVMPALDFVQRALHEPIRNDELAQLCNLSEDHFIRRFRTAVGLTPLAYVRKQRVAAAARYLLFTDQPIEAIAERTGFCDRFYFSRVFTQETGRPPAAYRRGPRT